MADEPMPSRWSFQDFKLFYDIKFGRKKAPKEDDAAVNVQVGNNRVSSNGSMNRTGQRNGPELSVYKQYRNQDHGSAANYNGVSPAGIDGKPQKSLFPPLESAEMLTLAES